MFAALWAKFGKWVGVIAAALAMLASIFYAGRKSGESQAKVKAAEQRIKDNEAIAVREIDAARDAAAKEVETVKGANDVHSNINRLDSGDAANKLRDEWSRD